MLLAISTSGMDGALYTFTFISYLNCLCAFRHAIPTSLFFSNDFFPFFIVQYSFRWCTGEASVLTYENFQCSCNISCSCSGGLVYEVTLHQMSTPCSLWGRGYVQPGCDYVIDNYSLFADRGKFHWSTKKALCSILSDCKLFMNESQCTVIVFSIHREMQMILN